MENFIALVIFVIAWTVVGILMESSGVEAPQAYMAAGAMLGMMLAYYYAYFGG